MKTSRIEVRCTPKEKEIIKKLAHRAHMDVSPYLVACAVKK